MIDFIIIANPIEPKTESDTKTNSNHHVTYRERAAKNHQGNTKRVLCVLCESYDFFVKKKKRYLKQGQNRGDFAFVSV